MPQVHPGSLYQSGNSSFKSRLWVTAGGNPGSLYLSGKSSFKSGLWVTAGGKGGPEARPNTHTLAGQRTTHFPLAQRRRRRRWRRAPRAVRHAAVPSLLPAAPKCTPKASPSHLHATHERAGSELCSEHVPGLPLVCAVDVTDMCINVSYKDYHMVTKGLRG